MTNDCSLIVFSEIVCKEPNSAWNWCTYTYKYNMQFKEYYFEPAFNIKY